MSEKQGVDMNGSSLYLDYMGQKSTFKSNRGAQRGGDRRGRGGFDGGDRRGHSNSGETSGSLFSILESLNKHCLFIYFIFCLKTTAISSFFLFLLLNRKSDNFDIDPCSKNLGL